ncbi:hypothetical protein QCA50_002765 [Cerrena zonata]|uniref:Alcohol dehydrogenase-like N-terminal domain-containing protein n=1 Tax=Cerrena zonata TaxID=2478898 RepID=A0AAW0GQ55_9APHY
MPIFDEVSPSAMAVFQEDVLDHSRTHLPRIGDEEILVRVEAMVEDPSDWRKVETVTQEFSHATRGVDFSGTVVKLGGPAACGVSVGDHVVGFVRSQSIRQHTHVDNKTEEKFIRLDAELAWVVPRGTLSHEDAAQARLGRYRYIFGV